MKQAILNQVFGDDGLLNKKTLDDFNEKALQLSLQYSQNVPEFSKYFENMVSKIREFVFKPVNDSRVPKNWKNNGCESLNHIIKLAGDWKKSKLLDLVDRLFKIVQLQYAEVTKAIHGQGNFELAGEMKKFQIRDQIWKSKSEEEKQVLIKKVLLHKPRIKANTITSTDGKLTINTARKLAKKPGSRKRLKANRTARKFI